VLLDIIRCYLASFGVVYVQDIYLVIMV